jgi:alpha-glucosidase
VVVARRRGKDWYIGAMTNWTARDLWVVLDFLPAGDFRMESYHDGVNAGRMASDYKLIKGKTPSGIKMQIHLAEGGGWAARIHP